MSIDIPGSGGNVDPSSERGVSLSLSPSWGASGSGGTEALLRRHTMGGIAADDDSASDGRLEAELGYGFAVFDGRATGTPWAGLRLSEDDRDVRLGYLATHLGNPSIELRRSGSGREVRLGYELGRTREGSFALRLGIEATRRESAGEGEPEHGVVLRLTLRW